MIRPLHAIVLFCLALNASASEPWRIMLAEAARAEAAPPAFKPRRGSFTLPSQVANNATVTVSWVTPVDAEGRPTPRANDVVCYIHYPGETGFAGNEAFLRLWQESGFTVFCAYFAKQAAGDGIDLYDRARSYVWAESGSFEVLRAAHTQLIAELGLPKRPMLVYGESAGATAAQHLSEEQPALIDGVAALGGHRFVQKFRATCPFLVLSTLGDATNADNAGLALYRRRDGHAVLEALTSPDWPRRSTSNAHFNHCMSRPARALARRWLEGLADLRRPRGRIPAADTWPLACLAADARQVEETARPGWRARLGREPVVYLPSKASWAAWMRQAPPPRIAPGAVLELPPRHLDPAGLVILVWRRGAGGEGLLDPGRQAQWDARWLLDQGLAVVRSQDGSVAPAEALAVAHRLGADPAWPRFVLLADPTPAEVAAIAAVPDLRGVVVNADLRRDHADVVAALERLPARLPLRIIGLTEGAQHAAIPTRPETLIPVATVVGEWPGKQRQQQITRTSQILLRWASPAPAAPKR